MPLASPPGRPEVVYGFGRIDASGRVADRLPQEAGQQLGQFVWPFECAQVPGPGQLDQPGAGQQPRQPGRDQPEVRQVLRRFGPVIKFAGRSLRIGFSVGVGTVWLSACSEWVSP